MANGKVVQVIGTVVDVEFPPDQLPALFNAIEIPIDNGKIVLEAEEHLPNDWRRFSERIQEVLDNEEKANG